jgi:hypothetical protein
MTTSSRTDNLAALGRAHAQKTTSEAWAKFCTVARFKVGGHCKIGGHTVSIDNIKPITGGLVYVKGTFVGGVIDGQYRPEDLDTV